MDFFQQQDIARRNTKRLVLLLALAIASLIAVTTALFAFITFFLQTGNTPYQSETAQMGFWEGLGTLVSWQSLLTISAVVMTVVLMGGLYKYAQLRKGGRAVAESLGGRLINTDTRDADERKILNVVEEMAVASGTAVPPVYLMEERAINAFAAGYTPQDAVIGITRGCITELNRDQLQGVVAHEFSHIFHGDMRLNMRLVALLNGLLLLGLIGHFVLRGAAFRGRSRGNNQGAVLGIGLGLIIIGYAGTFFGNIIKAAVSRQREFLADASAVQFTRNPDGIAGALKRIGGYPDGTRLEATHTAEFSHMYFGQAVKNSFNSLMATHPPLAERIQRIEPGWGGDYLTERAPEPQTADEAGASHFAGASSHSHASMATAVERIGTPREQELGRARQLLGGLGEPLKRWAHDSFSARALVFGLLWDNAPEVRDAQWRALDEILGRRALGDLRPALEAATRISDQQRLPLLELALPALKNLSDSQQREFLQAVQGLIRADGRVDTMEWALYTIVRHQLAPPDTREASRALRSERRAIGTLLSFLAHSGHQQAEQAEAAFSRAAESLRLGALEPAEEQSLSLNALEESLARLRRIRPLEKPRLLKAMSQCIEHDGQILPVEAELLRAVADSLNCPVPPIGD